MTQARSVHQTVTLFDDTLLAVGGYGGQGAGYLASAEGLSASRERWVSFAPMLVPRCGFACAVGPYGNVLVAGGTSDGRYGLSSAECYDPREKRWQALPAMQAARGYTAGCMGRGGNFYVAGGFTTFAAPESDFSGGLECFDFYAGKWRTSVLDKDDPRCIDRMSHNLFFILYCRLILACSSFVSFTQSGAG